MSEKHTIKAAYERNRKAIELRPGIAKSTAITKVRLFDGTTCEVNHKHWTFKVDIGKSEGGNDAGPGPGILERGALGSCLAIGISQQAAVMGVNIDNIAVDVESDMDASGMFGIADRPPGFEALRYKIFIESPATEKQVLQVIEQMEKLSPVLDDFRRAIPVSREIHITTTNA